LAVDFLPLPAVILEDNRTARGVHDVKMGIQGILIEIERDAFLGNVHGFIDGLCAVEDLADQVRIEYLRLAGLRLEGDLSDSRYGRG
jgi:hypothetical protein